MLYNITYNRETIRAKVRKLHGLLHLNIDKTGCQQGLFEWNMYIKYIKLKSNYPLTMQSVFDELYVKFM